MQREHLISLLKQQVKPAIGCTEPAAIAIAVARAYAEVPGEVSRVQLNTSGNIFKNANGVGIPGTKEYGIPFAVALALACGNADLGLEVFSAVDEAGVAKAKELYARCAIDVDVVDTDANFFIEATVTSSGGTARCIIRHKHTNVVFVEKDGHTVFEKACEHPAEGVEPGQSDTPLPILKDMTLKELREEIEAIPLEDIAFLIAGVPMNFRMAGIGLKERPGLALGGALTDLVRKGVLEDNLVNRVRIHAAAAADARMAGLKIPVMSSAGSGNHGIMAILPPYLVCRDLELDEEKLIRALALSHLVTIAIKEFSGSLSPVCGCAIAAGIGAAVSIAWLLDCTDKQIAGTINTMSGTLAGLLCDGAKGGCAFKLSTAAGEAVMSAMLAKEGVFITHGQGIVAVHAETTIQNIGLICVQGMKGVDRTVIDVMLAQ